MFAWEQRKFSEFVKNVAKKNKDNLDLEPYAVTNDRGFIAQKDAHDDFGYMKDTDRTAYNIVPPNSFAYNPARINVGSLGYYTGVENVIVSSLYEVFQTADYVDDRFLWHWLKSEHFPKWIEKLQEGSVRLYFYFDKLVQCQMMMPSIEEQKQISVYLDNIDNLITLHQRKCDETKKLKKFMLQKMFPQNGSNVPEIRFEGFTDAWEQRKLLEFGQATGGTSIESEFSEDGIYKVISIGSYSEDSVYRDQGIRAVRSDKTANRILNKGDITMILNDKTASGNIIGRVLLIEESRVYVYNQRTERIEVDSSNYDSQFIYEMLNAPNIREKIIKQAQGNTQIYVNWSTIALTEYLIPKKEEQIKIGQYLSNLDNLITLHQRKCDELKKMKKFMLQNMFV